MSRTTRLFRKALLLGSLALLVRPLAAATYTASNRLELVLAIFIANSDPGFDRIVLDQAFIVLDQDYLGTGVGLPEITTSIKIEAQSGTVTLHRAGGAEPFSLIAIAPGGYLTLERLVLSGGDVALGAGAINNDGTLVLDRVVVEENAGNVGAIQNSGSLTLLDSTVRFNEAWSDGGGLRNDGNARIERSLFRGNHADRGGGAIVNVGYMNIINSTLAENAAGVDGGAIVNTSVSGGTTTGRLYLRNVTIAFNTADDDASGFGNGGGVKSGSTASLYLRNTLIAENLDLSPADKAHDAHGKLWSQGYNLIGSSGGVQLAGDLTTNICDVVAELDALDDNGGETLTCALLPGSPAIDAGNSALPGGHVLYACEPEDQRGYARPADGDGDGVSLCDIGAFELHANPYLPPGGGFAPVAPTGGGSPGRLAGSGLKSGG